MLKFLYQRFQTLDFFLLGFVFFSLKLTVFFSLPAVCRVISRISFQFSIRKLIYRLRRPVQKIPVMRNHDHCVFIVTQIFLHPCSGLHIKMIRGLIQKQNIRFGQQQLYHGNLCLLPSGKLRQPLIFLFFFESKAGKNPVIFLFKIIPLSGINILRRT